MAKSRCRTTRKSQLQNRKPEWDELSPEVQGGILLTAAVQLGLTLFAQGHLLARPKEQVRGSKVGWFFGNFINFVGPIAYFLFGSKRR